MNETAPLLKQDFVFIKSEYKIVKIQFDDILYCMAAFPLLFFLSSMQLLSAHPL